MPDPFRHGPPPQHRPTRICRSATRPHAAVGSTAIVLRTELALPLKPFACWHLPMRQPATHMVDRGV